MEGDKGTEGAGAEKARQRGELRARHCENSVAPECLGSLWGQSVNPGKLHGPWVPEYFGKRGSENPEEFARHLGVWITCHPWLSSAL